MTNAPTDCVPVCRSVAMTEIHALWTSVKPAPDVPDSCGSGNSLFRRKCMHGGGRLRWRSVCGNAIGLFDNNPCTSDTCVAESGCLNPPVATGTPCDDGSACSTIDQCISGLCVGNPPDYDDGDPCTTDLCDVELGCTYINAPNGTSCSDGDPALRPMCASAGSAKGSSSVCGCQSDGLCIRGGWRCLQRTCSATGMERAKVNRRPRGVRGWRQ